MTKGYSSSGSSTGSVYSTATNLARPSAVGNAVSNKNDVPGWVSWVTGYCNPAHIILVRSEEHTSELQSRSDLVCRLLLEKKKCHARSVHLPRRTRSLRDL